MISGDMVGNVKGVIVLDNEGRRIIAKYYNQEFNLGLQTDQQQKVFERNLFQKSNKQEGSGAKLNMYENDIHKMRSEINAKMDYIQQKKHSLASDIEDQYHYNRYGGVMLSILATTTLYYVFFRLNK